MKGEKTKLKAKLDKYFSLYIRQSYANDRGMVACYTCGKVAPISEMQCGHYISRSHMATRWDESNARVQCPGCNVFKSGNYTEYAYRLLKEIGQEGMDALMKKKQEIRQWTLKELRERIEHYKKLCK